jgi:hypothetical protein
VAMKELLASGFVVLAGVILGIVAAAAQRPQTRSSLDYHACAPAEITPHGQDQMICH